MVKKMWALFHCGKFIGHTNEICDEKDMGKYTWVKPVFFSDRDPFENVRKVYERFKHLDKLLSNLSGDNTNSAFSKVWNALKKDLKNFDEGAG